MTKYLAFSLALVTVLLQVFSQLTLKQRVVSLAPADDQTLLSLANSLYLFLTDPRIIIAISAAFLGNLTWMLALTKLPLNQAYPFVALVIPLTAILATWIYAEPMPTLRGFGVGMIMLGVLIVSWS
jgi:drug/metabolite transporter (DMT)-like permease